MYTFSNKSDSVKEENVSKRKTKERRTRGKGKHTVGNPSTNWIALEVELDLEIFPLHMFLVILQFYFLI